MPPTPQSYANHARFSPLYHLVALPITSLYFPYTIVRVVQEPGVDAAIESLFALGVTAGVLAARVMALAAQDRVIRLEMRLRLKEILPAPLVARIPELTVRQLIALRFASDAEMPALVERVLNGEFARPRDIKRAVRDWQPDYVRV